LRIAIFFLLLNFPLETIFCDSNTNSALNNAQNEQTGTYRKEYARGAFQELQGEKAKQKLSVFIFCK
jgi:hypothetical protein